MNRSLHFAVLGLALCLVPETASAQLPFFNFFAPQPARPAYAPYQVNPSQSGRYPVSQYYGNYSGGVCTTGNCPNGNLSTTNYGPQLNCRDGVCSVNPATSGYYGTNISNQPGYQTPTVPYQVQPGLNNGLSPYFSNSPVYGPATNYQTNVNGCNPDIYGRCTNPTHNHYGQPVNSNLIGSSGSVPANYVSPYRDRSSIPANYYPATPQPVNNYYLGQLR